LTRRQPAGPFGAAEGNGSPPALLAGAVLPPGRRRKEGTRSAAEGPSWGEPFLLTFWGDCQKVSRRKAETVGGRPAKMDIFKSLRSEIRKPCTYPLPRVMQNHLSGHTPGHFLSNATKSNHKRLAPAWSLRCAAGPLPPASPERPTARNRSASGSVFFGYASARSANASSRPWRFMGHTIKINGRTGSRSKAARSAAVLRYHSARART
jgi:hypothetical protein